MRKTIDINCDLGELGAITASSIDAQLIPLISSCNVACGAHAGDPSTMRQVIELAVEHGVAVGAHVSYEDRENFGRVSMAIETDELSRIVVDQVDRLKRCLPESKVDSVFDVLHIKLHGALYHDANHDLALANAFVDLIQSRYERMPIIAMAGSHLANVCCERRHPYFDEVFADRRYAGPLAHASRKEPSAVLDIAGALSQVDCLLQGELETDAGVVSVEFDTICIHSDTPDALEMARAIVLRLEESGVHVQR